MQIIKYIIIGVLTFIGTACAHKTPITDGEKVSFCNFQRYQLNLDHRNNPGFQSHNLESLNSVLSKGFAPNSDKPIPKDDMLFLSGGSLNGAFGAGVIQGWADKENGLPDFSVVTGVSTGAILSLAAFTNTPQAAIDGYDVESESQAINAFVRRDENGKIAQSSYFTAIRKGALADISPLKDTIYKTAAEYGLFPEIAKRGLENRKLLTGVVDVDTGQAVALDMTAMAIKIYELSPEFVFEKDETIAQLKKRAPKMGHLVDCFTSAIAASSSVPLAARPIAIDNRLYIDGGARFLVFSDAIGPLIDPKSRFDAAYRRDPVKLYMIINGDQMITPKCSKIDCPEDLTGYDFWDVNGARETWNVLSLVERTVDVLKTQVGEFSESEIRFRALELFLKREGINIYDLLTGASPNKMADIQGFSTSKKSMIAESFRNNAENYNLYSIKIEPETLGHVYEGKTCTQWRKFDEITDRNLQFHLNYMRCMIDAGKTAIKTQGWD